MFLLDVDELPREDLLAAAGTFPGGDIRCLARDTSQTIRRWRPALILGDGASKFIGNYFRRPAPLPWDGLIKVEAAEIIADGLTRVGDRLLLGNSLMYPLSVFPFVEHRPILSQNNQGFNISKSSPKSYLSGTSCNLTSPGLQIYGHWLVDVMPRLAKCLRSGFHIDRYILPSPSRSWQSALLGALGVDEAQVAYVDTLATRTFCEKMLIPTFDRFNSEVRDTLVKTHREIASRIPLDHHARNRKIFVSRKRWGGARNLLDRDHVETIFTRAGYEIVYPETLCFESQIRLFASARIVVGECGSGMHNAVYCLPGAHVGVIQASDNQNFLQAQLAMWSDCDISYLVGETISHDCQETSFRIDMSVLDIFIDSLEREQDVCCLR